MSKFKAVALLLLSVAFMVSCEKESDDDNNNNNNTTSNAPITENRWKSPDTWEDYCDTITQTISGQEFLTFKNDYTVQYDLELIGNTYGCTGDIELQGTWDRVADNYFWYYDGDTVEVEVAADGSEVCFSGDWSGECWQKD